MKLKKLSRLYFEQGNVCVNGLRGCGKDMLFSNIINIRKLPYISLYDYNCGNKESKFIPLDFSKLDVHNDYKSIVDGDIKFYQFPYPDRTDIYLSDSGVILPSQYCNELNKYYKTFPTFFALSRHLGLCNVHFNTQYLGRVWDKLREQSDTYITCLKCKVIFKNIVIQKIRIYDKYESALNRVKPFKPLKPPLLCKDKHLYKVKNEELKRNFDEKNGLVRTHILIYKNRTNYDTRFYRSLFLGGVKQNEKT